MLLELGDFGCIDRCEFHIDEIVGRVAEDDRIGVEWPRATVVVRSAKDHREIVALIDAVGGNAEFARPAAERAHYARIGTGLGREAHRLGGGARVVAGNHAQLDAPSVAGSIGLIDRKLERVLHAPAVIGPGAGQRAGWSTRAYSCAVCRSGS